ncbi:hypothetical protein ANN_05130 [Periplaneta americana]|uniref:Uncharacterized protein n=1 Tax=Periplaneta americana TaxID=6978 RepID=A0ABQ8TBX8_PERAM|nr:hypothetical protein ANN_05130 [Periplaneta americana]
MVGLCEGGSEPAGSLKAISAQAEHRGSGAREPLQGPAGDGDVAGAAVAVAVCSPNVEVEADHRPEPP